MTPLTRASLLVIFVVIAIATILVGWRFNPQVAPERAPAVTFNLIDGQSLPMSQFQNKVLLVEFWATSCAVCLVEMPTLQALADSMRPQGLTVIAVAMPYDRPDHVMHVVRTRGIKLPVALDFQGTITSALGPIPGTPTRVLIGRDGLVIDRVSGPFDLAALRAQIEQALAIERQAITSLIRDQRTAS